MPFTDLATGQWLRCKADETPWFPFNLTAALNGTEQPEVRVHPGTQAGHEEIHENHEENHEEYHEILHDGELVEAWKSLGKVLPGLWV